MVKQSIWIGITIVVFFVGIGVSHAIFSSTYNPNNMTIANQDMFEEMMSQNPEMMENWMDTMMQDAQFHDQAMNYMANNPEQMNKWMIQDPEHVEDMSTAMKENHDFMMEMMSVMMNDPALRLQMLGHMTENPESMEQMKKMMGQSMMNQQQMMNWMMQNPQQMQEMIMNNMQDSDQMQMMEDMMADMMERMQTDPELKQAMMEHMSRMSLSSENMIGSGMNQSMMDNNMMMEEPEIMQDNVVYENGNYKLLEVAENIYSFGNNMASFSLVMVTDEGVIVGDSVNQNHAETMLDAIKSITDQPIKYLIYSHNHWDHTGAAQVFKDEGAIVLSHVDARDWLLEHPNPNVIPADEVWEGNFKEIVLGDMTLELHHFGPSHGEGMTVFYIPEEKIIFIVDIVTPKRLAFTIMPDFSPKEWESTLIEVEKLDFDTAMFGHKRAFGPASEVTEVREYLQDLRAEIFRMVQDGVNPFMIPSTIELPKYQDWEFYDEWLEMNTWRIFLEPHMGW